MHPGSRRPGIGRYLSPLDQYLAKIIDDDGFNKVFARSFEDITFQFKKDVDIEGLIDELEELDAKNLELEYPADCSYCALTIENSNLESKVKVSGVTIHAPMRPTPRSSCNRSSAFKRHWSGVLCKKRSRAVQKSREHSLLHALAALEPFPP